MFAYFTIAVSLANPPIVQDDLAPSADGRPTIDKIINGQSATPDDFPSTGGMLMSGIIFDYPFQSFVCSSTLIAPDVVLLAAHCLDDAAFTFGFGEVEDKQVYWTRSADLTSWDGQTTDPPLPNDTIEAVDWTLHEEFDMQSLSMGLANNKDIALLFLSEAVLDIEPAYLPTASEGSALQTGDSVYVVGWGQQSATGWNEQPPAGSYGIKQQGESFIAEINEYEFKVGDAQSDVRKCHGDSGGPSFWDSGSGLLLIGVTSHAYDESDCFETGGVDTRVDYYLNWINEEMTARCSDGTRVWCEEPGILPYGYFQDESDLDEDEPTEEDGKILGCSATAFSLVWYIPFVSAVIIRRREQSI